MGEGKGALIRRLQRGRGGGGGRSFDILAKGVDGYQSVGAYSKKYGNGEVLNLLKIVQSNCYE